MRQAAAMAGAALLLGGCAVLTIDVDVYKGPLSNDERVQVEQVAVMAVGAKPLLVQLRDRLEVRAELSRPVAEQRFDSLDALRFGKETRPWYEFDFVATQGDRGFRDDRAFRVNAVLGLYKNLGDLDPLLAPVFADARQAAGDLERASRGWLRQPGDADLATPLAAGRPGAFVVNASGAQSLADCKVELKDLIADLRLSYALLVEGSRVVAVRRIVLVHRCLLAIPDTVKQELQRRKWERTDEKIPNPEFGDRRLSDFPPGPLPEEFLHDNALYGVLAQSRVVDVHTALLLGPDLKAERERLGKRAVAIGGSWRAAREPLARLWRSLLQMVAVAGVVDSLRPEDRALLVSRAAHLASRLLDPFLFSIVLEGNEPALRGLAELSGFAAKVQLSESGRNRQIPDLSERDEIRAAVAQFLIRKGAAGAEALLAADRVSKEPVLARPVLGRLARPEARQHGLAEGPGVGSGEVGVSVEDTLRDVATLTASTGFEGGRLTDGLEMLIKRYRTAAHAGSPQETLRQLLDELTGFAQKVLFIANFSTLSSDEDTIGLPSALGRDALKGYTALLQAVGNSILSQVDELRRVQRNARDTVTKARIEDEVRRETWDPRQTVPSGGQKTRPLSDPMKQEESGDSEAQKMVLDRVIAELRYLHLEALKRVGKTPGDKGGDAQGKGTEADRIEAALREAYQQRARMVYLRPAGAYLRNSNPFTALQRESGATWRNMLAEHAGRQTPFRFDSSPEERKVIQEFDKQFWQNVNTVRVAGAGVTNYVVAKDDVGNWYVKGYSSDPKTIIQGAKSLALFAAGGSIGAGAMERSSRTLGVGQTPGEGQGTSDQAQADQARGEQIGRIHQQQTAQAKERRARVAEAVVGSAATTRVAVEQGWAEKIADGEQRKLLTAAMDLAATAPACGPGTGGQDALEQLGRFRDCRDLLLQYVSDAHIQAELKRRDADRRKELAAAAAEKKGALEKTTTDLRAAMSATTNAKAARAGTSESDPVAVARAEGAVRDAELMEAQRKEEDDRAKQELRAAEAALDAFKPTRPALDGDAQSRARTVVREQFRAVGLAHIEALEKITADERAALSALVDSEGAKPTTATAR